jgi:hypothetical protein
MVFAAMTVLASPTSVRSDRNSSTPTSQPGRTGCASTSNDATVEDQAIAIQTPQCRQSTFGGTGYVAHGVTISNGLMFRNCLPRNMALYLHRARIGFFPCFAASGHCENPVSSLGVFRLVQSLGRRRPPPALFFGNCLRLDSRAFPGKVDTGFPTRKCDKHRI